MEPFEIELYNIHGQYIGSYLIGYDAEAGGYVKLRRLDDGGETGKQ